MTKKAQYGQFCPVAKASELLKHRWTPLIMRELISGSARFNEIHRGFPLMSRALLLQRLKELEDADVICHDDTPAYRLTEAGEELAPVIVAALPAGRTVLQFDFADAPAEMRRWWLLIEDDDVDLCQSDPGFGVDLFVDSTVGAMGRVWIGRRDLYTAVAAEEIVLHGDAGLARNVGRWLMLSLIAEEAARQRPEAG